MFKLICRKGLKTILKDISEAVFVI